MPPQIDKLVKDLTSCDGGLDIRDRKQRLRTFKQCFPGSELVTWLVERRVALNRTEGVAVARFLQQRGIVVHITRSHRFHDRSDYLYFIDTLVGWCVCRVGIGIGADECCRARATRLSRRPRQPSSRPVAAA